MEATNLTKEFKTIAEITPPITEQWMAMALPSNPGWVSILLPQRSQLAYPLRPGAIFSIPADYVGSIVAGLGCIGMPSPGSGVVVFFSSEEQGEMEAMYLYANEEN